jgi:DNA-binding MarR family transcriptional regulator
MTTLPVTQTQDLDFARLLTLVERSVVQRLTEVLKSNGATVEEWRVLSLLDGDVGHTMTEIAEFAMVQAPTLTKVVDRMVSANLVLRRVDDADRRRVLVFASDRGRQAVRQWTVLVKREHDDLVSAVGPEEINLLNALLVRMSGRLG